MLLMGVASILFRNKPGIWCFQKKNIPFAMINMPDGYTNSVNIKFYEHIIDKHIIYN